MEEKIETLVVMINQINLKLDEISNEQLNIKKNIENNNKTLMKRINKMEEYNEINDIRNKITNNELNKLARMIVEIDKKLY